MYTAQPAGATREEQQQEQREQQAARDAVTSIPMFPELQNKLTSVFGPTAERDVLHQLVYWFSRTGMKDRWTLYKTFKEWREERGLNRKQIDKARARLKPTGIVGEKPGPYNKIHYRMDWVLLAKKLNLWSLVEERLYPLKGGQAEVVPPKGGSSRVVPPKGESDEVVPPLDIPIDELISDTYADDGESESEKEALGGVQLNTVDYSSRIPHLITEHESSDFQSGDKPASRTLSQSINKKGQENQEAKDLDTTQLYKRHSMDGDSRSGGEASPPAVEIKEPGVLLDFATPTPEPPKLNKLMEHRVWSYMLIYDFETPITRLCDDYLNGGNTEVSEIAEKISGAMASTEPLEAFLVPVERGLEERRQDREEQFASAAGVSG